jgi:glycosyltransferase involved in cell wall biosynthesis
MEKRLKRIIVLAYGSPSPDNGYGLALAASMRQYSRIAEKIIFICFSNNPVNLGSLEERQNITAIRIPIHRLPIPLRFLEGLIRRVSLIGIEYRGHRIINALYRHLEAMDNAGQSVLVFEDEPIAVLAEKINSAIDRRTTKVVLRSHNVLAGAFVGIRDSSSPLMQKFWNREINKISTWEKKAIQKMDCVWAISDPDLNAYHRLHEFKCRGVLGIEFDTDRYFNLPVESATTMVYIGSTDLRKRKGLELLIKHVWPKVRAQIPKARFVLAGVGTEIFSDPANGIVGLGHVEDDRPILSKGRIFVNPQNSGTGVKLKSIIAMAAGRTLVSTDIGVEGIAGIPGTHFISVPSVEEMYPYLLNLFKDEHQAMAIGARAREIAVKNYSIGTLDAQTDKLFRELLKD